MVNTANNEILIKEISKVIIIANLIAALQIMIDHAKEEYPHFESTRGQIDIKRAEDTIKKAINSTS